MRTIVCLLAFLSVCTYESAARQQGGVIKGEIKTSDNKPAAAVTILLNEGRRAVISNEQGRFEIKNINQGVHVITVSLVGYETIRDSVLVEPGKPAFVNFKLTLSHQQLEEVIVSAYRNRFIVTASDDVARLPLKNLENAQVYTTITKDLTRQQLAFSVDEALRNAPGVTRLWDATNRVGYGGSWVSSRGFSTQTKARNGIYANMIGSTDVANLEKIEVIKGPSATLFGNVITSYGGLINRVTKKPAPQFGGEVDYAGGSYNLNRFSLDINTPLEKSGKVLARTTAVFNKQNSFQDYGYANSVAIAPSLLIQPSDRLRITLDAELVSGQNAGGSQVIYFLTPSFIKSALYSALTGMGYPPATVSAILSTAPSNMKEAYGTNRADGISLDYRRSYMGNDLVNKTFAANFYGEVHYKLSSSWASRTSIARGTTSSDGYLPYFYLIPDMLPNFIASMGGGTPSFGQGGHHNMARMVWKNVGNDNSIQAQQNFIGDFSIGKLRNRMVLWLDYFNYNARITYDRFVGNLYGFPFEDVFDVVNTSGSVPNYHHLNLAKVDSAYANGASASLNYNNNNSIYSAFIHDVLNITDQLIVSAGLRVDHFSSRGSYDPVSGTYANKYNQTQLAPKLGVIFQPVKDQLSLFANYQSGFTNKTGVDATGKSFKPEQASQWEAGVKAQLMQQHLSATLSYYDITVKDIVRTDINNPFFNVQDGEQRSSGIEAELNAVPLPGLNIIAGYGYNNSKLQKADADVEGLRPVATGPEHTANAWIGYRFSTGSLKGFSLGLGANYVGESYAVNSHTDGDFILPDYTLINGVISYEQARFRIALKLNNISNEHYWVGWTTMNPQLPRQFIGSIAFKF